MSPRAKRPRTPSKVAPAFELTTPFIEALSCFSAFAAVGFRPDCMQVALTKTKISFLFTFGEERYLFEAAELPKGTVARQAVKDWRASMALWLTLPIVERNQMIAMSQALSRVLPFLEILAVHDHLPAVGIDGRSNHDCKEPCPFCHLPLRIIFRPPNAAISHSEPKCSQFIKGGANAVMNELNRRVHLKLLGFTGAIPSEDVKPS
jgi:hypothetical protein